MLEFYQVFKLFDGLLEEPFFLGQIYFELLAIFELLLELINCKLSSEVRMELFSLDIRPDLTLDNILRRGICQFTGENTIQVGPFVLIGFVFESPIEIGLSVRAVVVRIGSIPVKVDAASEHIIHINHMFFELFNFLLNLSRFLDFIFQLHHD